MASSSLYAVVVFDVDRRLIQYCIVRSRCASRVAALRHSDFGLGHFSRHSKTHGQYNVQAPTYLVLIPLCRSEN